MRYHADMPNTRHPAPDGYLLVDDAADLYGVSRATMNRWIATTEVARYRQIGDSRTLVKERELRRKIKAIVEYRDGRYTTIVHHRQKDTGS
jgi:hypothetical protein